MEFADDPAYVPSYWKDQISAANHDLHTIDCAEMNMQNPETLELLAAQMQQTFTKIGLVHLINTRLTDLDAMRQIAGAIVTKPMVCDKVNSFGFVTYSCKFPNYPDFSHLKPSVMMSVGIQRWCQCS